MSPASYQTAPPRNVEMLFFSFQCCDVGYEPDELTRLLHPAMYVRRLFTMGKAARKDITLPTI